MRFDVLTIFSEMFSAYLEEGVLGRAVKNKIVDVRFVNIRDFARGTHKTTDDRPYGGGPGMVMMIEPLRQAIKEARQANPEAKVVYMSPQGRRFDQPLARAIVQQPGVILVAAAPGIAEALLGALQRCAGPDVLP